MTTMVMASVLDVGAAAGVAGALDVDVGDALDARVCSEPCNNRVVAVVSVGSR
jgi:hypothetical protein